MLSELRRTLSENSFAVARSTIALATAMTLLSTPGSFLVFEPRGQDSLTELHEWTLFALFQPEFAKWIAVVLLAPAIAGWRPRYTCIVHWWVALSVAVGVQVLDGGEMVALVLTTLLLPACLSMPETWHWRASPRGEAARFARSVVCTQMSVIYFHACLAKVAVEQWRDGTAIYYFFTDPRVGARGVAELLLSPIYSTSLGVVLITWGTLVLELSLALAWLGQPRHRRGLLLVGASFHCAIWMVHGLASFSLTMIAGLILYLRPWQPAPVSQTSTQMMYAPGTAWASG